MCSVCGTIVINYVIIEGMGHIMTNREAVKVLLEILHNANPVTIMGEEIDLQKCFDSMLQKGLVSKEELQNMNKVFQN